MLVRYQSLQRPDLSPATSRTAFRSGSKTNKILTSVRPDGAGRSSFMLCWVLPLTTVGLGRPAEGEHGIGDLGERRLLRVGRSSPPVLLGLEVVGERAGRLEVDHGPQDGVDGERRRDAEGLGEVLPGVLPGDRARGVELLLDVAGRAAHPVLEGRAERRRHGATVQMSSSSGGTVRATEAAIETFTISGHGAGRAWARAVSVALGGVGGDVMTATVPCTRALHAGQALRNAPSARRAGLAAAGAGVGIRRACRQLRQVNPHRLDGRDRARVASVLSCAGSPTV
jgi:hypothetical protein